jgi:hypothetical protein
MTEPTDYPSGPLHMHGTIKKIDAVSAYPPELIKEALYMTSIMRDPDTVVLYFKLMDSYGGDYLIHTVQIPKNVVIGGLEFGSIDNMHEEPYQPILRTPFHMHGTIKSLHTICSRYDDEEVERMERD